MSLLTDLIDTLRFGGVSRLICAHCMRRFEYRPRKPSSHGYALQSFREHDAHCRQNPTVVHRDQLAVTNQLRIRTIDRMVRCARDAGDKELADELAEIALRPQVSHTVASELDEHYRTTLLTHYARPKRG